MKLVGRFSSPRRIRIDPFAEIPGLGMSSIFPPDSTFISAFGELVAQEMTPIVTLSFPYNINAAYVTSSGSNGGSVTQANAQAVLQTGTNPAGVGSLFSNSAARYSPGQGMVIRFTAAFTQGVANSHQEIGYGDDSDGFFFGYMGTTFGVCRRQNTVDTFIAQSAWNGGVGNFTTAGGFDPTKGNVYQIRYQWLGYGAIRFYIENPGTGELALVHTIYYPNQAVIPSIFNPSLPLRAQVNNSGNTTNLTLLTASMGAYAEGPFNSTGARFATGNYKTLVGTTLTNIFTIRNKATFQSKTNRGRVHVDSIATAITGKIDSEYRMVLNATLGGAPSYTDINTNQSIVDFDIAGTTVTGGREIRRGPSAGDSTVAEDISSLEIRLNPGDTLTFAAKTQTSTVSAALSTSWNEEL